MNHAIKHRSSILDKPCRGGSQVRWVARLISFIAPPEGGGSAGGLFVTSSCGFAQHFRVGRGALDIPCDSTSDLSGQSVTLGAPPENRRGSLAQSDLPGPATANHANANQAGSEQRQGCWLRNRGTSDSRTQGVSANAI